MKCLKPSMAMLDTAIAKTPQRVEQFGYYQSQEHRQWADFVKRRAGYMCENPLCQTPRRGRGKRMYADHKIELVDGGSRSDPSNGWCLCHACHEAKSAAERKRRQQA